jgi:hypothetical protein
MDDTGFVLRESDPKIRYYKYTQNRYPYYPVGLYQEEGEFHRFGDGQLLYFLQKLVNQLYDEAIIACKFTGQSRTFVDPAGQADPDDFDSDPSHPIVCRNPRENIFVSSPGQLNPVIERLIANIMQEARRATRFSDLMTGNSPGGDITATQAGIQTNQGNTGISDKKGDISDGLSFAANYIIGMCMELWESGQWFRISEDKDDFEWIDARQMANIPILIPADEKFKNEWQRLHPDTDADHMPTMMQYEPSGDVKDEVGAIIAKAMQGQTKQAIFDIEVSIGEGLPQSPISLYNIMLSLSQLQLIDEQTGMPRPLIGYSQFRKMVEEMLGIPFDDAMEQAKAQTPQMQASNSLEPINSNPNIPGANINGQMKTQAPLPG